MKLTILEILLPLLDMRKMQSNLVVRNLIFGGLGQVPKLEIQKHVTGRRLAPRACCFSQSCNPENKCFQKFITLVKMWLCQTNLPSRCFVVFSNSNWD